MNKQMRIEHHAGYCRERLNTGVDGKVMCDHLIQKENKQTPTIHLSRNALKIEQKKHKYNNKKRRQNRRPRGSDERALSRMSKHYQKTTNEKHVAPESMPLSSYESFMRDWNIRKGTGIHGKREYKMSEQEYYLC
jgi:hypothetical protein